MKNKLKIKNLNTPVFMIKAVLPLLIILFCLSAYEKDFVEKPIDENKTTILPDYQKEAPIVTNRPDIPEAEVSNLEIAENVKILDDDMIALSIDFNDKITGLNLKRTTSLILCLQLLHQWVTTGLFHNNKIIF